MKKLLVALVAFSLLSVVGLNLVLYVRQPDFTFYPTRELVSSPKEVGLEFEDVTLTSANGNRIHGWYVPGKVTSKALLFFHGNGGNISHRNDSLLIFNRLGFSVLIIDYQGYGKSEGTVGETRMYEDGRSAYRYLVEQRGYRERDIVVFGRSLGGAVAARIASENRPAGVVLESTFSSAADMAGQLFPLLSRVMIRRYSFDTATYAKRIHSPVLILHSRADEVIPFELGEKVYAAANKPKIFAEMEGDHNHAFIQSQPAYQQVLGRFMDIVGK